MLCLRWRDGRTLPDVLLRGLWSVESKSGPWHTLHARAYVLCETPRPILRALPWLQDLVHLSFMSGSKNIHTSAATFACAWLSAKRRGALEGMLPCHSSSCLVVWGCLRSVIIWAKSGLLNSKVVTQHIFIVASNDFCAFSYSVFLLPSYQAISKNNVFQKLCAKTVLFPNVFEFNFKKKHPLWLCWSSTKLGV